MCHQRLRSLRIGGLALLLGWGVAFSAFAGAGRTGAVILDLPHRSVRSTGLGEAFSSYHQDINTVLWNPSGIADVENSQIVGGWNSYEQVFGEAGEGLYYALFAGAMPLKDAGALGLTLQLNGQGTIDVTTDSPDPIAQENLGTNWVLGLTYADSLADDLRVGFTGKVIRLPLGVGFEQGSTATSYAIDAGAQYDRTLGVPMTFGLSVLNVGTRIQYKDANQSDPLPRKCNIGLAVTPYESSDQNLRVTFSGELVAAIDKLREDKKADDFVQTVDEWMTREQYSSMNREEVETELLKARGAGIYAFSWERMERAVGVEATVQKILAVRFGYKKLDPAFEGGDLNQMDRVTAGFGLDLTHFGLPIHLDYANGLWGGGGPSATRINTFALTFAF